MKKRMTMLAVTAVDAVAGAGGEREGDGAEQHFGARVPS